MLSYIEKIKLLLVKRPLKLERPKVIQFPVIDICNSKCQMCRIWENKKSNDITVDKLRSGLSSELFSEVLSIGFNGGEPTLRKDLPELVLVAIECLPSLKSVSMITNAYNYQDVIRQIESVGLLCKKHGKHFDLMVSLDGYGEIHDLVRGKKGNFERAQHVIDYAKNSTLVDSLRIGCTVIRDNVYRLADLLDYCLVNDVYIKYRLGVPHQRLYTKDLVDPYALTDEEKYEFVEFLEGLIKNYETGYLQKHFYRSLINQIIQGAPRRAGCDWQYRGATITAKGELAYCAVKSKVLLDDISLGDPEAAYFGSQGHLNEIIKQSCDSCNHDYVGLPNRADYFKYILSVLDGRLRLKERIRSIPGFAFVQLLRNRLAFHRYYNNFSRIPDAIKVISGGPGGTITKKIMICGWYGTETLGDKAIVAGIMEVLRSILGANSKITVVSLNPYVTDVTKKQMPEFDGVDVVGVDMAVSAVANYDYLLFGGGPVMAINELAPMQVLFEKARRSNVITVAAGVGVGPLGRKWFNDSIAAILKMCDVRIYRDKQSLEAAGRLGVDVTFDYVAEDPALTWLKSFGVAGHVSPTPPVGKEKILLLGLREFPYREYAADLVESDAVKIGSNFEKSIVDALERLISLDQGWRIKPLPMCTNHFGSDDRWFYRRLFRGNVKLKPYLDYSLLYEELAPAQYVESFKSADVLLGMRFHSVVFGLGLGLKTVAIDYTMGSGKVKALSDRFGIISISMHELSSAVILDSITKANRGSIAQASNVCENVILEDVLRDSLCKGGFL